MIPQADRHGGNCASARDPTDSLRVLAALPRWRGDARAEVRILAGLAAWARSVGDCPSWVKRKGGAWASSTRKRVHAALSVEAGPLHFQGTFPQSWYRICRARNPGRA